jgi:hypothetical protein
MGAIRDDGTSVPSLEASNLLDIVDAKMVALAAQGCREPNAKPLDARTCWRAKLYWAIKENLSESAVNARAKAAGRP